MRVLLQFSQVHADFRLPELRSVAQCLDIPLEIRDFDHESSRPFLVLELENEALARAFASRCILVKGVYELYADANSYEELHHLNEQNRHIWAAYDDSSFKFVVSSCNRTISLARQRAVVESFKYMAFRGEIRMKDPQETFFVIEEYPRRDVSDDSAFQRIYFGRLIAHGTARGLVNTFDVKKRCFYGNTSMEAEISLLMANQALASPGKFIYDPFCGTGSMLYTSAFFGAYVIGSDIDGRQMRGKAVSSSSNLEVPSHGITRAAAQYGVSGRLTGLAVFDLAHHPWRSGDLFDAIVTDPPYGVRAGAIQLGRLKSQKPNVGLTQSQINAAEQHRSPRVPVTKPYELSALARDLVQLSRTLLKPGGRLVFFLPTPSEEYVEADVKDFMCEGMEIIANSGQSFGNWSRRLITIEKTSRMGVGNSLSPSEVMPHNAQEKVPAHRDFRQKYFRGFKSEVAIVSS